jgi:hypothetical protein
LQEKSILNLASVAQHTEAVSQQLEPHDMAPPGQG